MCPSASTAPRLPIELRELRPAEIEELVQRHQLDLSEADLAQLVDLVGGHPYLLRAALYQLKRQRTTLPELLELAPTEGGLYNDHLRRHLLNLEADADLVKAFKQVIAATEPIQIGSTAAFKLNSMGVAKSWDEFRQEQVHHQT